jgi:SAM-dependent methyltransferase
MDHEHSFTRYLAAKKSIDDRALNEQVRRALVAALPTDRSLAWLEVGAGTGTMIERLYERSVLPPGTRYTAIDVAPENIAVARERLQLLPDEIGLELETIDFSLFADRERGQREWDVLVAHAFLDLVDLSSALPQLMGLLKPEGLFYFTVNFDGLSVLQPVIDPAFDDEVMARYHRTMDTRLVDGHSSGHSHTGRKLFYHLKAAGSEILAAGASDWVVYARDGAYPHDEAYFLHFIVDTIAGALRDQPGLDRNYFDAWIAQRQAQIEAGTLVYIAHQLDFCGRRVVKS